MGLGDYYRYINSAVKLKIFHGIFLFLALVTLKHGEEAEYCVQSLTNGRLKDKEVDVSLYRNDNLLCVANLPLTMEELDFRRLIEPLLWSMTRAGWLKFQGEKNVWD